MSSDFDPYLKWLAIPPAEQPPNHYRLLGVPLLMDDAEVIENAADQRMAHIRNFASGKHAEFSQRILNEISAAKVCLLQPDKKADYDARLKQQLAPAKPAEIAKPAAAAPAPRAKAVLPVAEPLATPIALSTPAFALSQPRAASVIASRGAPPLWQQPAVLVAIGACMLLAGVVIIGAVIASSMLGGDDDVQVAEAVEEQPAPPIVATPLPRVEPTVTTRPPIVTPPPVVQPPVVSPPVSAPVDPPQSPVEEPPANELRLDEFDAPATNTTPASEDPFAAGDDGELARFAEHAGPVRGLNVAHDGKYIVTASDDHACFVLHAATLKKARRFRHRMPLTGVFILSDRTVVVAGLNDPAAGGSIFAWAWEGDGGPYTVANSEQDSLSLAAAADENRFAVTMDGGHARIYFIQPKERVGLNKPQTGDAFQAIAFTPAGATILLASGRDVLRFEMGTTERKFLGGIEGETASTIRDVCCTPDSKFYVAAHDDGIARLCSIATGEVVQRFDGEHGALRSVAVDRNGQRLLTGDEQGEIRCWNLASGKLLQMHRGHTAGVTRVCWLPDGERFASASVDRTVRLWQASPAE